MNQLRRAIFGSHQPSSANNSASASSSAHPPQLSVPIPRPSLDSTSELGRTGTTSSTRTNRNMATAAQTQQRPTSFTKQEVDGLKAAQEQGRTVVCPDPSAHQHRDGASHKLQDQASAAALYVTHPEKGINPRQMNPLGPDGKLSSAGAATSLKHARAQDLPSFPSSGGVSATHSHGAANLAHTNQKSFEHWKPDPSEHAGKAALLAKDYKMEPLWQPEMSTAGGKAAVLAHRDGAKLNLWMPEASKEGHSAATLAMGKKGLGPNVQIGATEDQKAKALMAATGAHNDSLRKRGSSTPNTRPASTTSNRRVEEVDANKWESDAMQAARAQHLRMSREMYTEHPPVEQLDKEEQQHQAALRASAISMAKKLYATQQHHINAASGTDAAGSGAVAASRNSASQLTEDNVRTAAMQHLTLQDAAQKLAEERLAKMKTDEDEAYRAHYGYGRSSSKKISNRLSIRSRRRANSDVTAEQSVEDKPYDRWADSDDEEQSRKIRHQMSGLRGQVADVDAKKRQKDRQALLAAAEKKVQAQMHRMDERVFNDTGKMSPAMMEEYERNARKRLEEKRAEELERRKTQETDASTQKKERVHIGGGKHMDMAEIEEIARLRLQGTLQEIDEQAEKKRAEDEELRLEREEKKRDATLTKERERDRKAEEKRARAEEKALAKEEKEAEKAKRQEEKRLAKEEKERLKQHPLPAHNDDHAPITEAAATSTAAATAADVVEPETRPDTAESAATAVPSVAATSPGAATETASSPAPVVTSVQPSLTIPADREGSLQNVEPTSTNDASAVTTAKPTEDASTVASAKPTEDARPTTSTDKSSAVDSPDSPTKGDKGLKGLLNKLKRRSKAEPGQIKGFSGGHRLTKQKETGEDTTTNGNATSTVGASEPAAMAGGATAAAETGRDSPDLSSLDDSDEDEPRGRTRHSPHLDAPATGETERKLSASNTNSTAGNGDDFEEARDTFDEALVPPQHPAFTSVKEGSVGSSGGSPHRDSKFVENV